MGMMDLDAIKKEINKLGQIPNRYPMSAEKEYLINQIMSCLYTDKPVGYTADISVLKQIKRQGYYTEEEKEFLNVLRKEHLPQLKRKRKNINKQYRDFPV